MPLCLNTLKGSVVLSTLSMLMGTSLLPLPSGFAEWQPTTVLQAGLMEVRQTEAGVVGLDLKVPSLRQPSPVIMGVFPGSPAYKAGLRQGDTIVAIDGQPTLNWSRTRLDEAISDQPGVQHQLSVFRAGSQPFTTVLTVVALSQLTAVGQQAYSR
jgi:carboxyl-terminal processing protease